MISPILVLRPEPGAQATARRARAMGLKPLVCPLFQVEPVQWDAPDPAQYTGILMTSAMAARHAGPALAHYAHLPLFAVGERTAASARTAGFQSVVAGRSDVARLVARIATLGPHRLLHLSGADTVAIETAGIEIERRVVYASRLAQLPEDFAASLDQAAGALCHSSRAAQRLSQLAAAPAQRARLTIIAISAAAAGAVGNGWARVAIADKPRDEAMLEMAAQFGGEKKTGAHK